MTIGERIKQRRIELGLTQTELAHKMGLTSKTTICKAETTDFNPTTDRVREFAKALDCTPAYLMGWEDSKTNVIIEKAEKSSIINETSAEDMARALEFYEKYQKAIPQVQAAVLALLKDNQQGS